jgi:hypothetical protein
MASEGGWKTYRDFVLRIEPAQQGRYRVEAEGPGGEAEAQFTFPFDDKDLKIFLLEVGRPRQAVSRGRVPEPMQQTVDFGQRLFDAVIHSSVRDVFIRARHDAEQAGEGLRLQLRLADAPELADLPWEFLYDGRDFLALSDETPIIRYLELPNPPRPMRVDLPLRILVSISSPDDLPPLDVESERAKIERSLQHLTARGLVEIDFTDDASLPTLQRTLRQARGAGRPYHVWHYIGHGMFDPTSEASVLAFTSEGGTSYHVGGFQLGTLFNSYPDLRLALLNACEGARASREDPFAGVAAALIERGIPAVIGMQFEITDRAAITFSGEFYAALVDGLPVDAALIEARRAVFFLPNWVEWATPVLFMRVRDGQLFNISAEARSRVKTDHDVVLPVGRGGETGVSAGETGAQPALGDPPVLSGIGGPVEGQEFPLTALITTIGRGEDNLITLPDRRASRNHARFERRGDGLWVADLGSTNGTFVNGERIEGERRLYEGDEVEIGSARFVATGTAFAEGESWQDIVPQDVIPPDDVSPDETFAWSGPPADEPQSFAWTAGFLDRMQWILSGHGFFLENNVMVGGYQFLLGAKGKSSAGVYPNLDTFFVFAELPFLTLDGLRGFSAAGWEYASQRRSSMFLPFLVFPVVIVAGLDLMTAQAIESAAHPLHPNSYEYPVVIDNVAGAVYYSKQIPLQGGMNYPAFMQVINYYLGQALFS